MKKTETKKNKKMSGLVCGLANREVNVGHPAVGSNCGKRV